jgi:hypothetical protein
VTSTRIPPASHDVDLRMTRRRFLFARQQVAAHTRSEDYPSVRDLRACAAWHELGASPAADGHGPGRTGSSA